MSASGFNFNHRETDSIVSLQLMKMQYGMTIHYQPILALTLTGVKFIFVQSPEVSPLSNLHKNTELCYYPIPRTPTPNQSLRTLELRPDYSPMLINTKLLIF